ncbi:hypothetical protein KGF54_000828 [Candida jiufengensis]|uniref:uncharacterized protein n=1 Tax=Candida jiufengensis TaxID=497108 RepID=UPI002225B11A|nr:uncharacterized protein KGF54_000828 [Candida jiufengensis]KAI5956353.1 hypothetical protein KGF54_000828 [Candida jiufengensis]
MSLSNGANHTQSTTTDNSNQLTEEISQPQVIKEVPTNTNTNDLTKTSAYSIFSWYNNNNTPPLIDPQNNVTDNDLHTAEPANNEALPRNNTTTQTTSWYSFYRSFLFTTSESHAIEHIPLLQETTPLIKENSQEEETTNTYTSSYFGWFSWITGNSQETQEDDAPDESSEAYLAAKVAIETSKEECHYIFKTNDDFKSYELSVSGTSTEENPVHIRSKKYKPRSMNEVLEKSLKKPTSPEEIHYKVTPTFDSNYRVITTKTKLRIISNDLICGYKTENHLYKKTPGQILNKCKRLKRVVIIGVHNFLPTKMVRALIGDYTGTSMEYVNMASKAVKSWLSSNYLDYNEDDIEIQGIAIEGQGRISKSVEVSSNLLNNYKDEISNCDFMFVVGHLTSNAIAINILANLLHSNHHLRHKKIAVLSMAGNFLGPFPSHSLKVVYRAYTQLENEIVREMFEFEKKDSGLSIELNESMKLLISYNIKFIFTSSVGNPFIPLYSSMGLSYDHPNIYRNVFEGESIPFISSLLQLICVMKNLGQQTDYNIIKDFSDKLETSKTTRQIFQEEKVYIEAIKFALESTNLTHQNKLKIKNSKNFVITTSNNVTDQLQFQNNLPWSLRSLVNDILKFKHIENKKKIIDLITEFKQWEPTYKQYRDIKYCLEALNDFELNELNI